ncbi:MAG: toxin-antitoxin system YwqK family antitoxin [Opitutales bacterium]
MVSFIQFVGRLLPAGRVACLGAILAVVFTACEKPIKRKLMQAIEQNATEERFGILYDLETGKEVTGYVKSRAENSRVTDLFTFKNGRKHGVFLAWHENGRLRQEGYFRDGEEDGLWTTWYKEGGKKWEGRHRNGIKHGSWTMWHLGDEIDDDGDGVVLHGDGPKKAEGSYEDGIKHGKETLWHRNGRVSQRRQFNKGKREGRWAYWDNRGRLMMEEIFRDDELIDTKKSPDFWLQGKGS